MPLFGYSCVIEFALAQVFISKNERRMKRCEFVDKGWCFTRRFCRMISGLCRHISIQTVSRHLGLRWETVKNIDKAYLQKTLPALDPTQLNGLKNYSKTLGNQRRIEFRKANKAGKALLTRTHYLVLKNADKLNRSQT